MRALAEQREDRGHRLDDPLGRNGVRCTPGLVTLVERRPRGQQLVEPAVRLGERGLRHALGPDAVARLDLVEVGDLLAGEDARVGAEPTELVAEPARARLVESRVRQLGQQLVRIGGKRGRRAWLFGLDRSRELGRPVVGVDESVDVAAEPKPERQIPLDDRHRSKSAAWPWPTPTHIVATP